MISHFHNASKPDMMIREGHIFQQAMHDIILTGFSEGGFYAKPDVVVVVVVLFHTPFQPIKAMPG